MQTTMTHDKTEVSEALRAGWKRKQQTTINSAVNLPSGGRRQPPNEPVGHGPSLGGPRVNGAVTFFKID